MSTRILVVDDQPTVTRACVKILSREGYSVSWENSSHAALERLQEETFDILLTDVRMPELDGMGLLEASRILDPHLSVVVMTGYGTMDDAIKAIRLGAQGFLLKPYDPDELLAVIKENIQRRALFRDSIRLQTLLPLLQLSDAIQEGQGAASITEQALQVASREIEPGRLQLWLKQPDNNFHLLTDINRSHNVPEPFSAGDLEETLKRKETLWADRKGGMAWGQVEPGQAMAVCFPLIAKSEGLGTLIATVHPDSLPLNNFQLELLQVLSGQLAVAIDNINLFQRVETLGAFNKNIIENINTGLIAFDQNRKVTVFNKAASKLLDIDGKTVIGQNIATVLTRLPQLAEILIEPLNGKTIVPHKDLIIDHWDGRHLSVLVTASALHDTDNQLTGVVGLIEDLTELKALEAERHRLDRLAALGEMSAVVAHELRNPIAGIAAGVDYLTKKLDLNATEYQGSRMILREVDRVHRIVEDILMVARPLELEKSRQPLKSVVMAICQRHQQALEKSHIATNLHLPDSLPHISVDEARMEQVFDNLVSNAIHAMPSGGAITIAATVAPDQREMVIHFSDTGKGLQNGKPDKIFDPFFTTKTRGVGLGLALTRRIIEAHGGDICVIDNGGIGTTFSITLPLN